MNAPIRIMPVPTHTRLRFTIELDGHDLTVDVAGGNESTRLELLLNATRWIYQNPDTFGQCSVVFLRGDSGPCGIVIETDGRRCDEGAARRLESWVTQRIAEVGT